MSSRPVVKPVILYIGALADKVIHTDPVFRANCGSCAIKRFCETKDQSRLPVITSRERLEKKDWEKLLENSNCRPVLRDREW